MAPTYSPWGEIDWSETLAPGIEMVATPSHGGIMVDQNAAYLLSSAARKCGFWEDGYLCFEEDADENVVLRELLDRNLWQIPERIKDPAAFEANIDKNIKLHHPEYWATRSGKPLSRDTAPKSHRTAPAR